MSKTTTIPAPAEAPAVERLPYFDHSECEHEKTPKARAACRAKGEAAVYYGRDKAPKADAPTKTRKGRKAKAQEIKDAPEVVEDAPAKVKVKKAKKVKLYPTIWSSKGTGAITHWAIMKDDAPVPACGNRLTSFDTGEAAEVLGCQKCRAKDPATLAA